MTIMMGGGCRRRAIGLMHSRKTIDYRDSALVARGNRLVERTLDGGDFDVSRFMVVAVTNTKLQLSLSIGAQPGTRFGVANPSILMAH